MWDTNRFLNPPVKPSVVRAIPVQSFRVTGGSVLNFSAFMEVDDEDYREILLERFRVSCVRFSLSVRAMEEMNSLLRTKDIKRELEILERRRHPDMPGRSFFLEAGIRNSVREADDQLERAIEEARRRRSRSAEGYQLEQLIDRLRRITEEARRQRSRSMLRRPVYRPSMERSRSASPRRRESGREETAAYEYHIVRQQFADRYTSTEQGEWIQRRGRPLRRELRELSDERNRAKWDARTRLSAASQFLPPRCCDLVSAEGGECKFRISIPPALRGYWEGRFIWALQARVPLLFEVYLTTENSDHGIVFFSQTLFYLP